MWPYTAPRRVAGFPPQRAVPNGAPYLQRIDGGGIPRERQGPCRAPCLTQMWPETQKGKMLPPSCADVPNGDAQARRRLRQPLRHRRADRTHGRVPRLLAALQMQRRVLTLLQPRQQDSYAEAARGGAAAAGSGGGSGGVGGGGVDGAAAAAAAGGGRPHNGAGSDADGSDADGRGNTAGAAAGAAAGSGRGRARAAQRTACQRCAGVGRRNGCGVADRPCASADGRAGFTCNTACAAACAAACVGRGASGWGRRWIQQRSPKGRRIISSQICVAIIQRLAEDVRATKFAWQLAGGKWGPAGAPLLINRARPNPRPAGRTSGEGRVDGFFRTGTYPVLEAGARVDAWAAQPLAIDSSSHEACTSAKVLAPLSAFITRSQASMLAHTPRAPHL